MTCQINKSEWGPALWTSLHTLSLTYPAHANAKQQQAAFELVAAIGSLLPRADCARNWHADTPELSNVAERRRIFAGRDAFARYLVTVHNRVNRRLGKPVLEYDRARAAYCPSSRFRKTLHTVLLAALVLAVLGLGIRWGIRLGRR